MTVDCVRALKFTLIVWELCSCCVVHCDCRWNRGSVQQSIIIVGGVLRMHTSLYWLSVVLYACVVVHNDFRWNCGSVH